MRLKQFLGICIIFMGTWLYVSGMSYVYAATCDSLGGSCTDGECTPSAPQQGNEGDYSDCLPTEICCVAATPAPESTSAESTSKSEVTKVVSLDNPISVGANPSQIIGMIIKAFLGVVGGVALVMMVFGGFKWLTSAGNPEKVKSGTGTMLWAIIGLILVLASYLMVNTILQFMAGFKG